MAQERGDYSEARVEHEDGRWAVYLDVWLVDADHQAARVDSKRIADYPPRAKADVAARWIERGARRKP